MATAPNSESYEQPGGLRLATASPSIHEKMSKGSGMIGILGLGVFVIGVVYAAYHLLTDLSNVHDTSIMPYVLLAIALLVALGFEFVNGFHDTANAVATVIYTHSLDPHIAVVWSGFFNFLGVLLSSGLVAFSIVSLLPVELILQVGSRAGFAMVFALLIAAIIWNLGTWYFGLPASSFSHHDRFDHWSGYRESANVSENGHQRRRLGASHEDWAVAAVVADRGLCLRVSLVVADEGSDQEQGPLRGSGRNGTAAILDSFAASVDLHGSEFRARIE